MIDLKICRFLRAINKWVINVDTRFAHFPRKSWADQTISSYREIRCPDMYSSIERTKDICWIFSAISDGIVETERGVELDGRSRSPDNSFVNLRETAPTREPSSIAVQAGKFEFRSSLRLEKFPFQLAPPSFVACGFQQIWVNLQRTLQSLGEEPLTSASDMKRFIIAQDFRQRCWSGYQVLLKRMPIREPVVCCICMPSRIGRTNADFVDQILNVKLHKATTW